MNTLRINAFSICVAPPLAIQAYLIKRIRQKAPFLPVVTFNISMMGAHDDALRWWIQRHALITVDGISVSIMLWRYHRQWVPRYPGIDMVTDLLTTQSHQRVALLGGRPESLAGTVAWVTSLGHDVVFSIDGYTPLHADAANRLAQSAPRIILVAMGCPKQDECIRSLSNILTHGVAIGVGGAFDIWSGQKKRAPIWVRRCGLEWLARSIMKPTRILWIIRGLLRTVSPPPHSIETSHLDHYDHTRQGH